jgi:dienelactone hydrolase
MPSFAPHARQRMTERGITDADVEAALKHRLGQPRPGDNGRIVVLGYAPGGRILKIVLTPDEQCIVSVMVRGE